MEQAVKDQIGIQIKATGSD